MKCTKCFQEIAENAKFCPFCGAEQTSVQPDSVQVEEAVSAASDNGTQTEGTGAPSYNTTQQDEQGQNEAGSVNYGAGQSTQNNGGAVHTDPVYGAASPNYTVQSSVDQGQKEAVNWIPYLVLSIISTICCCPPFGIVGIVFSAKINSALNAGDTEGAKKSAKTAKIWIIVAFAAGIISYVLYFVFIGIIGASSASYYYYRY